MSYKIKSLDGESSLALSLKDSIIIQGQANSFCFDFNIEAKNSKFLLENVIYDEHEIREIIEGLEKALSSNNHEFSFTPEHIDFHFNIANTSKNGHFNISYKLRNALENSKYSGAFDCERYYIQAWIDFFKSVLAD